MGDQREPLSISVVRAPGDYGRDYIQVEIGDLMITVYESELRPGGVTVEIDGEPDMIKKTVVNINDGEIFPANGV